LPAQFILREGCRLRRHQGLHDGRVQRVQSAPTRIRASGGLRDEVLGSRAKACTKDADCLTKIPARLGSPAVGKFCKASLKSCDTAILHR
jgi:hypothetical protein